MYVCMYVKYDDVSLMINICMCTYMHVKYVVSLMMNVCMCTYMYVKYVVSLMMNIRMCTYVCTYKHTHMCAESSHCIVNVIF